MAERDAGLDYATGRQLSRTEYNTLKTATRTLRKGVGSQEAAATVTRVEQGQLSKYEIAGAASDGKEHWMPIDVVADLEAEIGKPVVTAALAELLGYRLVQLPKVANSDAPLGRVTAEALKEVGDVFSTLGAQLSDGTFTSVEDRQLGREIDEAIVKLLQLKAQAHAVVVAREGRR